MVIASVGVALSKASSILALRNNFKVADCLFKLLTSMRAFVSGHSSFQGVTWVVMLLRTMTLCVAALVIDLVNPDDAPVIGWVSLSSRVWRLTCSVCSNDAKKERVVGMMLLMSDR